MNIHRYYEKSTEDVGFLHDVNYRVREDGKTMVDSLQPHVVENGVVTGLVISHQDPMNSVSSIAAYSVLVADKVIDMEGNFIL